MRTTDRTLNLSKIFNIQFKDTIFNFQLEYFKKNIEKILQKETKIRNIYIASDSKKIKNYIIKIERKKYSTFYNNTVFKKGFRKTSGEDFLIDFFSLLKMQYYFVNSWCWSYTKYFLINQNRTINWNNQINRFIF